MLHDAYRLQGSIKKKTTDAITEPGASRSEEANVIQVTRSAVRCSLTWKSRTFCQKLMFLACRSDRLLDQRNGLFLCIVTHSYYKAYNNSFQQGFHILFQQNNSRNWNVDVHCELNSLLEIPVCAQDLLTLQLYYFFGGVDQALFSQSCSFRPDNGLNIFCCELTSTVQTLGALITMESFNDDVYSMRARTRCVKSSKNSLYAPFSFPL